MKLPKVIRTLIETYAIDMGMLVSGPKRINSKYMRVADSFFTSSVLCHAIFSRGADPSEVIRLAEYHFERTFMGTAAGWVYMQLFIHERRRSELWESIGVPVTRPVIHERRSITEYREKSNLLSVKYAPHKPLFLSVGSRG